MNSQSAYRFAHLSDPHLSSLQHVKWHQLLNKRLTGYLSWRKSRRAEHRPEVLDAMLDDLHQAKPEHVAVTGDLTHIGLPQEFHQAQQWLERLGQPQDVTVIPGNHDAYVPSPWLESLASWQPWMLSDSLQGLPADQGSADIFPSLRIRGPVAFIGLSSAVPSPPFFATGQLGNAQLERLAGLLTQAREQALFRVVLVHHPAVPGTEKWRKRLIDAPALCEVIARNGAELVLHGHSHRVHENVIKSTGRSIPVIGIPSASAIGQRAGRKAQYYLYTVARCGDDWELHQSIREYDLAKGAFRQVQQRSVKIPQ